MRKKWESARINMSTYFDYAERLTEIALSMFAWQNMPEEIDTAYIERTLFYQGAVAFFYDEILDEYLCLPFRNDGRLDVYNNPQRIVAYATNGYQKRLSKGEFVIIYNTYLKKPSARQIENYAQRLYNYDRIIDVNINAQKTPILVSCDENERLTLKNVFQQYDGNELAIFGNKTLAKNALQVLKTDAPFVADKVHELRTKVWNDALTYLGIPNMSYEKRSRLVSDEVARASGGTLACRESRLSMRKKAAEKINSLFDLDLSVEFIGSDISTAFDSEAQTDE